MNEGFTQEELAIIKQVLPDECANDAHFPNGNVVPDKDNPYCIHIYANGYTVLITKCKGFWSVIFSTSSGNLVDNPLAEAIMNAKERFMDRINGIKENEK